MNPARLLALLFTSVALASASAQFPTIGSSKGTSFSADMTGIWFDPAESGWGANIIQQKDTMFVTVFVYGADSKPLWLVGSNIAYASSDGSGAQTYFGTLYQTTGPYFGAGSFNSASVVLTTVGTLSLRFGNPGVAQLTYTVNGVTVTKNIVPQSFKLNSMGGLYVGGSSSNTSTPLCTLPLQTQGPSLFAYDISPSGANTVTIKMQDQTLATCTLEGTVTQYGKLVDVVGTYTCSAAPGGQFAIRRLDVGIDGLTGGYYSLSNPACTGALVTIGASRVQ